MTALCAAAANICRTSPLNRGAFRDEGFVVAVVGLLQAALDEDNESDGVSACNALSALCTANDGNKKAASLCHPAGFDLVLVALGRFPDSPRFQTSGVGALLCLVNDDDPRQPDCIPSAVETRDRAITDKVFPKVRKALENALDVEERQGPFPRLREKVVLALSVVACRESTVHEMVFEGNMLSRIETSVSDVDERVVRACLALIRAFGFADEIKEQIAVESDVALKCVAAVQRHLTCPSICEQAFGLFANLSMRKPHIATRLNGPDVRVLAVGQRVLEKHPTKPNVIRTVYQTMRNIAAADQAAEEEVRDWGIFDDMLQSVKDHKHDARWKPVVDIASLTLREFRADSSMRAPTQWNDYY